MSKEGKLRRWSDRAGTVFDVSFLDEFPEHYFPPLSEHVDSLSAKRRSALLRELRRLFRSQTTIPTEIRVQACKLLVALLPESSQALKFLIRRMNGRADYEIHFSLFCWLDDLQYSAKPHSSATAKFVGEIPSLIHAHLSTIKSDAASAAWMAGDLLGDHWQPDLALPVLLDIASHATYKVGRKAAIHGLEKLSKRLDSKGSARSYPARIPKSKREIMKSEISRTLNEIASSDRSADVRIRAKGACAPDA